METTEVKFTVMKDEIAKILNMDPQFMDYNFSDTKEGLKKLDLTTQSPNGHKTMFLFHSCTGNDFDEAMLNMFNYVTKHMKDQDTYQVRWHNPETKRMECSWFRASNIVEALSKFYHGEKAYADYIVYEVQLRPQA